VIAKIKNYAGAAGLGAIIAGKIYLADRYLRWRARRQRERMGIGINRNQFARLPRSRQRSILYYRRHRLQDLEQIYGSRRPVRRRRFSP